MPTDTNKEIVDAYLAQLSEQEKLVLEIAKSHLLTSFDITKSIGFIEWKKNNNITS